MLLGDLINRLAALDPDLEIRFSNGDVIGKFDSYRGFYNHLALEPGEGYNEGFEEHGYVKHETVGALLEAAEAVVGKTFEGYKGGEYVMDRDTPLWLAPWGESTDQALVDVVVKDGDQGQQLRAVLVGHNIAEYIY